VHSKAKQSATALAVVGAVHRTQIKKITGAGTTSLDPNLPKRAGNLGKETHLEQLLVEPHHLGRKHLRPRLVRKGGLLHRNRRRGKLVYFGMACIIIVASNAATKAIWRFSGTRPCLAAGWAGPDPVASGTDAQCAVGLIKRVIARNSASRTVWSN